MVLQQSLRSTSTVQLHFATVNRGCPLYNVGKSETIKSLNGDLGCWVSKIPSNKLLLLPFPNIIVYIIV